MCSGEGCALSNSRGITHAEHGVGGAAWKCAVRLAGMSAEKVAWIQTTFQLSMWSRYIDLHCFYMFGEEALQIACVLVSPIIRSPFAGGGEAGGAAQQARMIESVFGDQEDFIGSPLSVCGSMRVVKVGGDYFLNINSLYLECTARYHIYVKCPE